MTRAWVSLRGRDRDLAVPVVLGGGGSEPAWYGVSETFLCSVYKSVLTQSAPTCQSRMFTKKRESALACGGCSGVAERGACLGHKKGFPNSVREALFEIDGAGALSGDGALGFCIGVKIGSDQIAKMSEAFKPIMFGNIFGDDGQQSANGLVSEIKIVQ